MGKSLVEAGAVMSDCKAYRYRLWRYWDIEKAPLCFVMLNPSTADYNLDDPTIRKCMGFAERFGYGGIEVVNLYAYRATNPQHLLTFPNRIGKGNDDFILSVARSVVQKGGQVVVAWGAHPAARLYDRGDNVLQMLFNNCIWPYTLGLTKAKQPGHPLMLSYDRELVEVSLA